MDEQSVKQTKRCGKCDQVKVLEMFSPHGGGRLQPDCKLCRARAGREARAAGDIRNILTSMVQRCHNMKHPRYPLYGARGITVCDRWRGDTSAFLNDMGPRPSNKHSVERVDNDRGYSPANCVWATQREQCRNTRRTRWLTVAGVTKPLCEWAEIAGIRGSNIEYRLRAGWSVEDAVRKPRGPKLLTVDGVVRSIVEWAEISGTDQGTIHNRTARGWPPKRAVFAPVKSQVAS